MRLPALPWIGVLALAGCTGIGPSAPPDTTAIAPAAWRQAHEGSHTAPTPLAQWWLRFRDPVLTRLVEQSLQANTRIASAQAALRQAQALRDVAAASLGPGLDASASAQRTVSGHQAATRALRIGVDARWSPDLFGEQRQALNASAATVEASAAQLAEVQVALAAEVALAYIALRSGQARLAIADDNLASQRHTLQITEWRQQAGLVSALDVQQARAAAEQTQALRPALQSAIVRNQHALAVLSGEAPAALEALLQAASALPQADDDLLLALPVDTLRQRADVRAAAWQWQAAAARVAQADAARRPSLALGGTLGLGAATLGALGDGASVVRTLLVSLAWPLFDGGAARGQVRAQQAALDQAREAWRGTVLLALQEVEDALALLQSDRERILRLGRAAQAATQAASLARQSYQSGLVDYQRVLETQRNQLATQDSLAGAQADFSADQVRLIRALGGGASDEPGAVPPTLQGQAR